jgi:hypothetical protein
MNHTVTRILLVFPFLLSGITAQLQNRPALINAEISLQRIVDKIKLEDSDSMKAEMNGQFREELKTALEIEGSIDYPFDSLTILSTLSPPDKSFRLITWNLQVAGMNRFFGFIQVRGVKGKKTVLTDLEDRSDSLTDPSNLVLGAADWLGALYYQIIPGETRDGRRIYTLLGWHGINPLITARVIDVLSFSGDTIPRFGMAVFCTDSLRDAKRIIYKYSAKASMLLRYDEQMIVTGKKWNPSKREFEVYTEKHPMITANRLVPMDPQMEGQYEYYIPASDIIDGFIYKEGCWTPVMDIDARNPRKKGSEKSRKPDK